MQSDNLLICNIPFSENYFLSSNQKSIFEQIIRLHICGLKIPGKMNAFFSDNFRRIMTSSSFDFLFIFNYFLFFLIFN